jgi:hypothetical protein
MNDNERKSPGEGKARHGYQNEVSWDDGQGGQPYANQDAALAPDAFAEVEAGNRGEVSGRNLEEFEAMKKKPEGPAGEAPRDADSGEGE